MSNVIPLNFDGHAIRVVTDAAGAPWFAANEICDVLGFGNPRQAIDSHVDQDDVQKLDAIDSLGRKQLTNHVNESGLYALIFGSTKSESKRFKKWVTSEVLPAIRMTGGYVHLKATRAKTLTRSQLAAALLLLRSAAEDFKYAPSALLGSYQKLEAQVGVQGLLPHYAVDSSATGGVSSDETKSAAELLELHGVGISAIAFNRLLVQHGFLEERERPSTKGGIKKFKVCTDLEYGKNLTSPNNPRETQPHWYVSKFAELLDLVLPEKPKMVNAR